MGSGQSGKWMGLVYMDVHPYEKPNRRKWTMGRAGIKVSFYADVINGCLIPGLVY